MNIKNIIKFIYKIEKLIDDVDDRIQNYIDKKLKIKRT